jgi:long-chain fatty acid transport protein
MIAIPRGAGAAGFATAHFGGEHGSVVTTNPTALYYNPGSLGFSEGTHLFLDGQIALRGATWDHPAAPSDPPSPPNNLGNSGHASLLNVFGAPSLSGTMKLGNLAFGAGFFIPFGGLEHWSKNDSYNNPQYPSAVDGVQRWHIIDGQVTFIYLTAGAAYRLGPLSIGVTGNIIPSTTTFRKAQDIGSTQLPNSAAEGRANLDVSGTLASFGAGIMLEAVPNRVWIGASYQAQPGLGQHTLDGTLLISAPGASLPPANVSFTEALPDIFRAGVKWRVDENLELRLFADYTRWSVMQNQCLSAQGKPCLVYPSGADASGTNQVIANYRRNWNDTYNGHVGGSYWLKPEIELFAGAGFETAATPDATLEPGLGDADNVLIAAGARFLLTTSFYFAVSYTHLQFLNRDNTGRSALANAVGPTVQADGGGKYTQWVGVFDLNLEKQF